MSVNPSRLSELPYLEHFPEPGGPLQRVYLTEFPFRLGRNETAHLPILYSRVSKVHAEIRRQGDKLSIVDLDSTNGTFVNGSRVRGSVPLTPGDIVHLAQKELRFGWETELDAKNRLAEASTKATLVKDLHSVFQNDSHLQDLIQHDRLATVYHSIHSLADRQLIGYEALGRGQHPHLPANPGPLFTLAQKRGLAVALSRAFRRAALAQASCLPQQTTLFLNLHPEELLPHEIHSTLEDLVKSLPLQAQLVLEVHEDFVAELPTLERLREQLHGLGVQLAYDDFGVGQARLRALADVPADFVKLDMTIVQGLPHSRAMRELVRALGRVCADLGTTLLAEGLETEQEVEICLQLGCVLGQGYLWGHPQPVDELFRQRRLNAG